LGYEEGHLRVDNLDYEIFAKLHEEDGKLVYKNVKPPNRLSKQPEIKPLEIPKKEEFLAVTFKTTLDHTVAPVSVEGRNAFATTSDQTNPFFKSITKMMKKTPSLTKDKLFNMFDRTKASKIYRDDFKECFTKNMALQVSE